MGANLGRYAHLNDDQLQTLRNELSLRLIGVLWTISSLESQVRNLKHETSELEYEIRHIKKIEDAYHVFERNLVFALELATTMTAEGRHATMKEFRDMLNHGPQPSALPQREVAGSTAYQAHQAHQAYEPDQPEYQPPPFNREDCIREILRLEDTIAEAEGRVPGLEKEVEVLKTAAQSLEQKVRTVEALNVKFIQLHSALPYVMSEVMKRVSATHTPLSVQEIDGIIAGYLNGYVSSNLQSYLDTVEPLVIRFMQVKEALIEFLVFMVAQMQEGVVMSSTEIRQRLEGKPRGGT
jgi:uncharacterized protein YoxC